MTEPSLLDWFREMLFFDEELFLVDIIRMTTDSGDVDWMRLDEVNEVEDSLRRVARAITQKEEQ